MASILILEDQAIVGHTIRLMLEELGHAVVSVCRLPEQAIEEIRDSEPEVVLLDVGMAGELSGADVLRMAQENGFSGKAYFVSAYPESTIQEELDNLTYDGYLAKPVDRSVLERHLGTAG
jgi:CheY-like chemotaxis protein